jgi:hypothetical protein
MVKHHTEDHGDSARYAEIFEKSNFVARQKIHEAVHRLTDGEITLLLAKHGSDKVIDFLERAAGKGWNAYAWERWLGIASPESDPNGAPLFTSRQPQRPAVQQAGPFLPPPHGNLGETLSATQDLAVARFAAIQQLEALPKPEESSLADVPF